MRSGANQLRVTAQRFQGNSKGSTGSRQEITRITVRQFLFGDQQEGTGYGLYSYVLFGHQPTTDATQSLYVSVMREYLAFPEAIDYDPKSKNRLNVTFVPLKTTDIGNERSKFKTPEEYYVANYNYARASTLLAKIPGGSHYDGPYLVSTETDPLSGVQRVPDHYLYQDMSAAAPEIVALWIKVFRLQSGKANFWQKDNEDQAVLALRNAIAVGAVDFGITGTALEDLKRKLATILFWKK